MSYRGLLVLGIILGAAAGGSTACAGPEAGSIIFSERSSGATDPADPDNEQETQGATVDGGKTGTGTKGTPPFNGSAFVAGTPENGPAKGKLTHTMNADKDPSGVECISCHAATFAFAGTVYTAATGGAGRVAGAEIRVTGPDGKVHASAFSDPDGNFWIANTGLPIPAQSKVGVRNGTKEAVMSGVIGGADGAKCNNATGCHGGTALRIFL